MEEWLKSPTLPFYPEAPWWVSFVAGFVLAILLKLVFGGKKKKG